MWRGPPLDDLADEPFAAAEIRRLQALRLEAREAAIDDAALAEGRQADVPRRAGRTCPASTRCASGCTARRMLALYRCGRQAEALEAYRTARQVLLDEVGLKPGPSCASSTTRSSARTRSSTVRRPACSAARRAAAPLAAVRRRRRGDRRPAPRPPRDHARRARVDWTGSPRTRTGVIDPGSGHIVAEYMVGHTPDALAAGDGSVWIANGRDGTVSRVDRAPWLR